MQKLLATLALVILVGVARPSHAGTGSVSYLVVNMTPDAESSKASSASVRWFRKRLETNPVSFHSTELHRVGETHLRKLVGIAKDGSHFMSWSRKQFESARVELEKRGTFVEVIVLIDSRPKDKTVDILLIPHQDGPVTFKLRSLDVDKKSSQWLADAVLLHADRGWNP